MKNLEGQERKLADRKKRFREESDGFDREQEVNLISRKMTKPPIYLERTKKLYLICAVV